MESMMILLNALQHAESAKTALVSTDHITLSYADLYEQFDQIVHILRAAGIGRHDRVALVLPDGLPMAVAFLGVAGAATRGDGRARREFPRAGDRSLWHDRSRTPDGE
jgi:acyl-CoA synthetase (AMP-forming)/AMP-acid ligase II